jgi:hypothetical protein
MRFMKNVCLLIVLQCTFLKSITEAFSVVGSTSISFSPSSTRLGALTAKDILARARKAVGRPEEEDDESPKLFDDDLLDDMQKSLLMLEKRVKQGPRSLGQQDIEHLEEMLERIVTEMEIYLANGGKAPSNPKRDQNVSSTTPSYVANNGAGSSPLVTPRNASPGGEAKPLLENLPAAVGPNILEHNEEEGEQYNGVGGLGLAKGTTNTYVIPGMDEMTGEEYREALQRSVSDRQARRRQSGLVGNMTSQNYLDNL